MTGNRINAMDANIALGRFAACPTPSFQSARELHAYMDKLGIGEALVYSAVSRECGPDIGGDDWLIRETAGSPRLHPCLTLVPEPVALNAAFETMRARGITCGRVFPKTGHFSVRPWCLAPVAEMLLKLKNAALFIDFELTGWSDDSLDWAGIRDFCLAYPDLPVVLIGASVTSPRLYARLMGECRNLHLEISRLFAPRGLERLCADGYGRRIVLGSDGPANFGGGILSCIRHADIEPIQRADISGNNLRRLLALERPRKSAAPVSPAVTPAIDMHVHYGRWHHSECGPGDTEGIIGEMDRCAIDKAVLTSIAACYGAVRVGNEAVANACRARPDRLFGYITLDPKQPEEMEAELNRYDQNPSFRGLKFHCGTHRVNLDSGLYNPAIDYANHRNWPILIHGSDPADVWIDLCNRYPRAKLILAHAGGMTLQNEAERQLISVCGDCDNFFLDLACSKMPMNTLETLIETAGPERVLYGSDYPIFDFGYERGRVDYCDLAESAKKRILSENARELFKL